MSKTLKEFQELDGWQESLDRFAEEAIEIKDCEDLQQAAKNYLVAEEKLRYIMYHYQVEMG